MNSETTTKLGVGQRINWPGLLAGVLAIAVPFLGAWWKFKLGTEAVVIAASPFGMELNIFGETISSPLLWWLGLGLKLVLMYFGLLLLLGSVLSVSDRYAAIAKLFVRFSARKLLWLVIAFVAILFLGIMLVNQLPGLLGLSVPLQLPYLTGEKVVSISLDGLRLTIPVTTEFPQPGFVIAVLAAALGISAWFYQKRIP